MAQSSSNVNRLGRRSRSAVPASSSSSSLEEDAYPQFVRSDRSRPHSALTEASVSSSRKWDLDLWKRAKRPRKDYRVGFILCCPVLYIDPHSIPCLEIPCPRRWTVHSPRILQPLLVVHLVHCPRRLTLSISSLAKASASASLAPSLHLQPMPSPHRQHARHRAQLHQILHLPWMNCTHMLLGSFGEVSRKATRDLYNACALWSQPGPPARHLT